MREKRAAVHSSKDRGQLRRKIEKLEKFSQSNNNTQKHTHTPLHTHTHTDVGTHTHTLIGRHSDLTI